MDVDISTMSNEQLLDYYKLEQTMSVIENNSQMAQKIL